MASLPTFRASSPSLVDQGISSWFSKLPYVSGLYVHIMTKLCLPQLISVQTKFHHMEEVFIKSSRSIYHMQECEGIMRNIRSPLAQGHHYFGQNVKCTINMTTKCMSIKAMSTIYYDRGLHHILELPSSK